ncbi:hypothetical protein JXE04_00940 [Patescibacteria group bacterium]|nr:hypothetical protein [Patescibacteria group bacterium]
MADKKIVKKTTTKVSKKAPVKVNKTREEIEELFSANFGCDCSCCSHHCGQEE